MDVRSIRKTLKALTSPSCFLLFDGLRVEFATTAAPSNAGGFAPSNPAAGVGADAPTGGAPPPEEQGSSVASKDSTADPGRHGRGEGDSASIAGGDLVGNGAGGGSAPPPVLPSVEIVRVLSVEVADREENAC